MRYLVALGLVVALPGCGGSVAKTVEKTPAGEGGGPTTSDHGGTEPLDDLSGSYPPVPDGSAAFFWRWGLGNWFIGSSTGMSRDAAFEDVAGVRVWSAGSEAAATLDLWAQLQHPSGAAIDLSDYSGIAFEARVSGTNEPLVVAFNANGDHRAAQGAKPEQRFAASGEWQTGELRFDGDQRIASIDFITASSVAPFTISVRNLALRCKATCP